MGMFDDRDEDSAPVEPRCIDCRRPLFAYEVRSGVCDDCLDDVSDFFPTIHFQEEDPDE